MLNKKSFFKNLFSKRIWVLSHFMNDNVEILCFNEFYLKFNLVFDVKIYNKLMKATPLKSMVR